jgi:lysophospholipase L1-like esterase
MRFHFVSARALALQCVAVILVGGSVVAAQDSVVLESENQQPIANASTDFLNSYRAKAVEKWEKEIKKIEARDAEEQDPDDAILFIGSSSIRRWDQIDSDMAPYRAIQRGYGGAKYSDLAIYAERLIQPHQYRALVIFVGNDVSGKPDDRTPSEVEALVRYVVGVSKAHQPTAPVLLIEVTPTQKRFAVWGKIREINAVLREVALSTPHTYFIATADRFLDPTGNPRNELFVDDQLHLNEVGYDRWAKRIHSQLHYVLRSEHDFANRIPEDASTE